MKTRATVFVGLGLVGALSGGCGSAPDVEVTTPEASPTPDSAFVAFIESKEWYGWHTYEDEQVKGNIFTAFYIYAVKESLWCGSVRYRLDTPGTYLAYVNGQGEWEVVLDVQEGDPPTYGTILARVYGSLFPDHSFTGWADHYQDVNISDADVVPEMEDTQRDFTGHFDDAGRVRIDPDELTYDELMLIIADASVLERATAVIPEGESIDLPEFVLPEYQPIDLPYQETYCAFCVETETPSPGLAVPTRSLP